MFICASDMDDPESPDACKLVTLALVLNPFPVIHRVAQELRWTLLASSRFGVANVGQERIVERWTISNYPSCS